MNDVRPLITDQNLLVQQIWAHLHEECGVREHEDAPNVQICVRVLGRFYEILAEKLVTHDDNNEERFRKPSTALRKQVIWGTFYIYNNYGLLSETVRDRYLSSNGNIVASLKVDGIPYYKIFKSDMPAIDAIALAWKRFPWSVLENTFGIECTDSDFFHRNIKQEMLGDAEIQRHNPMSLPALPRMSATSYAFQDGILYLGTSDECNDKKPVLEFYEWADLPYIADCDADTRVFRQKQFIDVPVYGVCEYILAHQAEPGFLRTFMLEMLDKNVFPCVYPIAIIILTQTRAKEDDGFQPFDFKDRAVWEAITDDEWDAIRYVLCCIGWVLGVYCDFPVCLWLQGVADSGKSTIMTFVRSLLRETFVCNTTDDSKFSFSIATKMGDGTFKVADAFCFPDIQYKLSTAMPSKMCDLLDTDGAEFPSEKKNQDPIAVPRELMGNRNVRSINASNIPINVAIPVNPEPMRRRSQVLSFNQKRYVAEAEDDTMLTADDVEDFNYRNPSWLLKQTHIRGPLVALCLTLGHLESQKWKNFNPSQPVLIRQMNAEFERDMAPDQARLVERFFEANTLVVARNVAVSVKECWERFEVWYDNCFRFASKNKPTQQMFHQVVENIADFSIEGRSETLVPKYERKLFVCLKCHQVYSFRDLDSTERQFRFSRRRDAEANAQSKERRCKYHQQLTLCTIDNIKCLYMIKFRGE